MTSASGAGKPGKKASAARPLSGLSLKPAIPYVYLNRRNNSTAKQTSAAQPNTTSNGSSLKIQHNAEAATPETVVTVLDTKEDAAAEASSTAASNIDEEQSDTAPTPAAVVPAPAAVPHQAVISPTPYSMPPAFQPTPRALGLGTNGDMRPLPRHGLNGPAHMHHPHPSNGSLQFGHFDSNNSSPAPPPHSAGFAPPPGLGGLPNGQRPFPGHGHTASGHGYPPQMPYGTEFVPVTSGDAFGRSSVAPAGMEHYPHQHHGHGGPNGVVANHDDRRHHHHHQQHQQHQHQHSAYGPAHQRMMSNHMPPPHMMQQQQMQEAQNSVEGLFGYLQSQFTDLTFVDCTLELRYLDDRAPPVRIPGHRLVFARSQPLRNLLQTTSHSDSHSRGMDAETILLKTDDKYINSSTFWMAIQRLYSFPLLSGPPEGASMGDGNLTLAGNADTRFDFALGYAAAGKLLNWDPIIQRGMQVAADHLSWSTLEKALEFILGDLPGRASADRHAPFAYGEQVQILMTGVISFIINNFPAYFRLDTSVADPESFARIPNVPAPAKSTGTPPIAHGTSVHLGAGRRARPMHIKFGDMGGSSASQDQDGANGEVPNLTPQQRAVNSTLSRVLLNLPFAYLKPALESSVYGNVSSWANSEARHQIMVSVVSERELRRLRALEGVKEGRVPHAGQIRHSLQSVEPRNGGDVWHILGWQEEMVPYHGEGASLGRKWTPLMYARENGGSDHQHAVAAYP
ncbi:uncharacterized protein VDAG_09100 [Verticillium dahliae VdLs.17]|uniref:Uncharacterized protein n=1 Tax=Verticillium dahliae (strain VdLs.17 / ATCC MYA-4575 / FGSC 10137) TaxID=498257 RepID=G2XFH6_VERDV|nr:uncharacterized protein VDAG_09100 [Verticillium dahliae VdLs.17]EGY18574.1 hypothetical protein VDAG_09100 [Verticillium dahliae VdLs.17]